MTIHLARNHETTRATWCGRDAARQSAPVRSALGEARSVYGSRVVGMVAVLSGRGYEAVVLDGAFDCARCRDVITRHMHGLAEALGALPPDRPTPSGCGDNSCVIRRPGGMATNGGCRCAMHEVRAGASEWRRYALALEARLTPANTETER